MNHLEHIESKIWHMNQEFELQLAVWRFHEHKIVFTNGCFDLLHLGHIDYLAKAAAEGTLMIVGMNSDESVQRIKGDSRPIKDEKSRAMTLAAVGFVGAVVIFDEDTPEKLIEMVQPDILVKGKDYEVKDIIGADIVEKKGGQIITMDLVEGYSTSAIIDKIRNS
ncbi:MAG: D-glycero-beta-D-manno-heptose 1-phosphate adenylyltransferase [Bacteroidetes bacterium]|nr:MAG: D-glycero-beta-D-manno-heptose 1-phosphate adenylyltransferase [Bacteroidota bacterium]RLD81255.1 MAG: D-glycero-beta-D-manno-heptose 1-phosphate adenylyltransferase [Bacteroidota bacterium]